MQSSSIIISKPTRFFCHRHHQIVFWKSRLNFSNKNREFQTILREKTRYTYIICTQTSIASFHALNKNGCIYYSFRIQCKTGFVDWICLLLDHSQWGATTFWESNVCFVPQRQSYPRQVFEIWRMTPGSEKGGQHMIVSPKFVGRTLKCELNHGHWVVNPEP